MKNILKILAVITVASLFAQPVFAVTTLEVAAQSKKVILSQTKMASSTAFVVADTVKDTAAVQKSLGDYVPGEIIVKFKENRVDLKKSTGITKSSQFATRKNLSVKENIRRANLTVFKIKGKEAIEPAIARLKADPDVEYVQPNYQYYPSDITTNDTSRGLLWGLDNTAQSVNGISGSSDADIDAPEAWVISEATTSTSVIVAVIDSGVAYNHPDLLANMWSGTGCVDENGAVLGGCNHGYDFEDNDKTPLPSTSSHGTHIAGTIAAVKGNGLGIMGVAPQAKIMAMKTSFTTVDNVKSINFAKQNGAKVINASWGCYVLPDQGGTHADCTGSGNYGDQALSDAIAGFPGLFIAPAGNGDGDSDASGDNHDSGQTLHSYPCDLTLSNIICVAATDQNDSLATFSNYGATSVDVGAPGTNIYSTVADSPVMSENFNSITAPNLPSGWVTGGTNNKWATYNFSGDKVIYGQVPSFPYDNNANTTVTSPTYNLGSGTSGANIDFWARCDTEYLSGWWDYMQLEYSADGVNFSVPPDPYYGDLGDGFRWDEPTLDIFGGENPLDSTGGSVYHYADISIPTQYLTSNFKFRFRWVTDSSGNNYDGCWVDDVKITKFSDGSDEKYAYSDGTSMATPHVAGLAALIEGYNPSLTSAQVKNTILTTGDSRSSLSGTVSGKRINAQKALQAVNPAKAITAFTIPSQVGSTTINEAAHTIAVTVPFGTNVTALVPTIATSTGASVSPLSGVAHNFTATSTYTVTAADGSTQAYAVTVTVAPAANHTISGTMKYYDGIKTISGAIVTLSNASTSAVIATTTTSGTGTYQFTGVASGGNYLITASKNDNASGLSSADQIKIGRHIVGLELFSTIYKTIAGDVNNSGGLSSADQIKIGRFIVGLDSSLLSGAWKFYSSDMTLATSTYLTTGLTRSIFNATTDISSQDFIGIKMGDVNNSWTSN